ncbi:bifunctional phosphoglucose/phosphomannose isomerase [bacterium]|nr:bifunctional phosphoglucose/phosphomannose isomerase [bacterium]
MKNLDSLLAHDKHNILGAVDAQPAHLRLNFADSMDQDITPSWGQGLQHIALAGMGGSALAADMARNWLASRLKVPFEIVRGYNLPEYVEAHSLVILSSYSGNTEETLAAYEDAKKRSARIVVMTAGGELLKRAEEAGHMLLKLPEVSQPRLSVFAGLKALACLLEDAGLTEGTDLRRELLDVADWLDIQKSQFNQDDVDGKNLALDIAEQLVGKPVVIYGGMALRSAIYKWKIDINENAKQQAWCNAFPELNHNEMQGWLFSSEKTVTGVVLRSSLEHERILKRIDVMAEVLKGHGYEPIVVEAQGTTPLQQLLWTILLGDYMSSYLGMMNEIDPTPVELVEVFKKKLG